MTVNIWDILQIASPVLIAVVGFFARLILGEVRAQRAEMKEYVRQETCRAHREHIQRQLDTLGGK